MLRRLAVFLATAFVATLLATSASLSQTKKSAIPGKEAQAKAEALIQELFKDDLAKAQKDPAAKARLAMTFLQEGKDTNDDPAGRYVLYRHALTLASEAGDAPTALQAIEEMALEYGLPAAQVFRTKIDALLTASKAVSTPDAYHTVMDAALVLLEDALAADDFPAAQTLITTAENAGRKLKNVALVASIRKRGEDVSRLQKEYAAWEPYAKRLAQNPADPEANAQMGIYQALIKGNWERGLPLLAKGNDAKLKPLAALDLAEPKDSAKQAALAEQWRQAGLALAKGRKDHPILIHALLRSYHWYQQALADATPGAVSGLEKRMQEVMDLLPPEYRVGEIAIELKKCEGHFGPVFAGDFSPDGKRAVSAGGDNSVRLWDVKTAKELKRLDGHSGRVWTVAFAPDGRRVFSGSFDGTIRLWDLASGREIRRFTGHTDYVRGVAVSGDGHLLLSGGDDRTVRLWNADTGKEIQSFPGHNHFVWCVALSRDGKRALSGSLDKTVRLWDTASGKELKKFEGHADTVLAVAFSPEGRRAVSASTDQTLKVWDLETGKELKTLTGHKGYVQGVAFSPDGRRILSAGQDHTVRLWDAHTGKELRTLEGHRDQVWHVAFSRDGRLALSTGHDQTLRIWGGAR